jgi:hypothetical protein
MAFWLMAFSLVRRYWSDRLLRYHLCGERISDLVEAVLDAIAAVVFGILAAIAAVVAAIFSLFGG